MLPVLYCDKQKALTGRGKQVEKERVAQSMLFDFYGDLLTEKQRECCNLYYNEDLSLSEIAEQRGISRQGVWDNIRHAEDSMRGIEEKIGLIRRFEDTRAGLQEVRQMLKDLRPSDGTAKIVEKIDVLIQAL